jgi:uncharacterized protein (TIGR02001 family)
MSSHDLATPFHRVASLQCTRSRTHACTLLALCTLSAIGHAQAGNSGNLSLTSDYVFRGISQNNQHPALQAGFEHAADNGLYAGAWGSNISWLAETSSSAAPISSSLELDAYAGWRGTPSPAVSVDVGVQYYAYPGHFPSGFNRADTLELYAGVTLAASKRVSLGAKYSLATTDLFGYADSNGSGYLDLSATFAVDDHWSLAAHAGKQWISHNAAFAYRDWKLGITRNFSQGVSVALAYTGSNANDALYTNPWGNRLAKDTLVLTLNKTF